MRGRGWWGWCGRWGRGRALAALLLLGAALVARVPMHSHLVADFPDVPPHALAHFLADFSNYPKLYPDIESWSVEEESGNYTWWRYSVSYSCGARCSGWVEVWHGVGEGAEKGSVPSHGANPMHRLTVKDARCSTLPMLPFPRFCDEQVISSVVGEGEGAAKARGSLVSEAGAGACGAGPWLRGRCGLAGRRRAHLDTLRSLLASMS